MYAVKGGWVGQTFALAKSNDSGGKKSRIRRSKEDRKAMVESFIKRHQISNNGSFPSLNLTHKEVGGSFYTIREIVREIIQENRVLGPAKPTGNEQEVEQFNEKHPLGTISIDCQTRVSLDKTHLLSKEHERTSKQVYSTPNEKVSGQQLQKRESPVCANGISLDIDHKVSEASKHPVQKNYDLLKTATHTTNQKLESVDDILERPTSKVTPLATDVVVETFPVISASNTAEDIDGPSVAAGKLIVNFEQDETKKLCGTPDVTESGHSDLLDGKIVEHISDHLFETLSPTAPESDAGSESPEVNIALKDESTLQTTNRDPVFAVMEPKPAPENGHCKSDNNSNSCRGVLLSQGATKNDKQNTLISEEGKHSTLNRSKLPSWEGSPKGSREEETTLLGVFKAFISACVKFWTE